MSATLLIARAEFETRFIARIVERLTGPESLWTDEGARSVAQDEWDAYQDGMSTADAQSPEDAADECISYWDADGDE